MNLSFFVLVLIAVGTCNGAALKTVSGNDLDRVVIANEYLMAVFVEPDCDSCKEVELELVPLAFGGMPDVTFVRVLGSKIPQNLGKTEMPAILFYRHSKPVIYDGLRKSASIEEWITLNRESALQSLADDTFEHLTQASSGATTGDWLVLFCNSQGNNVCQGYQPIFETVAAKLKGQKNVAVVETSENPVLKGRFSIEKQLQILFFRLGNVYEYSIDKIDVASLTSFALGWYKNVKGTNVPVPSSPFDQLLTNIVHIIKDETPIVLIALALPILGLIVILIKGGMTKGSTSKKD